MELLLGGMAAVGAGCFTNPLEVVKIRMQLQGELQSRGKYAIHYRNVFHAAFVIGQKDGILALQKGLFPALWYQLIMNGTRLGLYDWSNKRGFTKDRNGNTHFLKSGIVASFSGCIGAVVGSPFFLVKTHLQALANEASIAVGHQHKHRSMSSALQSIYGQYGVKGLYRGITSSVPRVVVASGVQLSTFEKSVGKYPQLYATALEVCRIPLSNFEADQTVICQTLTFSAGFLLVMYVGIFESHYDLEVFQRSSEILESEFVRSTNYAPLSENRWISALAASLVSGVFVSVAIAPFDLISIRFYNQGVDSQGKGTLYTSVFDCGRKIFQKEGFRGFFKGWTASYFRLGPHTLLSLVFWDQLKHYYRNYEAIKS